MKKMKVSINKFDPCKDGLEYYETKDSFEQAWNDCQRGDWMLWIASKLEVDHRTITRAKVLCANTVRHLMKDKRSVDAVDASLRYSNGEISVYELNKYVDDAFTAARVLEQGVYVVDAAAYSAYAASHTAYSALIDSNAASYSAYAAARSGQEKENQLETSKICREILTKSVFEKLKQN